MAWQNCDKRHDQSFSTIKEDETKPISLTTCVIFGRNLQYIRKYQFLQGCKARRQGEGHVWPLEGEISPDFEASDPLNLLHPQSTTSSWELEYFSSFFPNNNILLGQTRTDWKHSSSPSPSYHILVQTQASSSSAIQLSRVVPSSGPTCLDYPAAEDGGICFRSKQTTAGKKRGKKRRGQKIFHKFKAGSQE